MIVFTILLVIGVGIFLLWFGEALMRDASECEENMVIDMRTKPQAKRTIVSAEQHRRIRPYREHRKQEAPRENRAA